MWNHARHSDERLRPSGGNSQHDAHDEGLNTSESPIRIGLNSSELPSRGRTPRRSPSLLSFPDLGASQRKLTIPQLLHPHRQTSLDSRPQPIDVNMANASTVQKAHTSPSKPTYGRTYDSKLVSREMARLGGLTSTPLSQATSSSSVGSAPSMSQSSISSGSNDPWGALHVHVLPLFNGEPLRSPIETLNGLVRRHVQSVVSSTPSKALANLEQDASELIAAGMVTINAKLSNVEDEKLLGRVVEIWGFFWDQVLTYLEGVLLPLQTDPILSSLSRKPHRGSSPTRQGGKGSGSGFLALTSSSPHIDVRSVALRSFREKVIFPLYPRLFKCVTALSRDGTVADAPAHQPRLQQMLLVLTSQNTNRPSSLMLSVPAPQLTQDEQAISDLLHCLLYPRTKNGRSHPGSPAGLRGRAPSFLSGGGPRDRRGRIAQKDLSLTLTHDFTNGGADSGDDLSIINSNSGKNWTDLEREKDREFLDALKSPEAVENPGLPARVSVGGWGLGHGKEEKVEEEEDEPLTWDQAQTQVERMLGLAAAESAREGREGREGRRTRA